ncbi:MAG TPA: alpha/beta fold hydrolase [Kofleriaceae bacterium]|nr:alpha/beta fold hydrolase [Kofleriaceae bacterium]
MGADFAPPAEFDGFRVESELGHGAMGRVYLGRDLALDRPVALKFPSGADPDAAVRKRFLVEARAIARLSHPNVVSIYRIGEIAGRPYLAYEHITGRPLSELREPLRWPALLHVALGIARGLAAAHQRGVLHRDIKPANVMLSEAGEIKILDFGIAKLREATLAEPAAAAADSDPADARSPLTHHGAVVGTPRYLAPELWRGGEASPRSDVYSLGLLLRGLCHAGRAGALEPTADTEAMMPPPPPPPSPPSSSPSSSGAAAPGGHGADVPAAFTAIIDRCLRHQPEERFASATELRDELELLLPAARAHAADAAPAPTPPITRYTTNGSINLAYQVFGSGPIDLVFVPGWVSHLEVGWEEPSFARFLWRLGSFARVITFDKRGTGLSDRVTELPSVAVRMEDARAVMDAAGSERAVLFGISEGACLAMALAATYPQRARGLVLYGAAANPARDLPREMVDLAMRMIDEQWGGPVFLAQEAGSRAGDEEFARWWARYLKMSASPGAAKTLLRANLSIDVEYLLSSVHVPTLVLHREGDMLMPLAAAQAMTARLAGARLVVVPGADHLPFTEGADQILDEIERFVAGTRTEQPARLPSIAASVLAIESDELTGVRGACQEALARLGGAELVTAAGRLVATFESTAHAVACARELLALAATRGVALRTFVHAGDVDLTGGSGDGGGATIDAAARLAETVPPGSVHVSREARDLLADGQLAFDECAGFYRIR